ncbi:MULTISPECIES: amino acid ABC transporter substrate-binding protein [unclassified Cryobacterium]|uniref:amino acid ABC transporter substrate-binding protein n=1 Tax=unclassified Cryobacterium TaxID=2649013 RepID=UPI002AB4D061|nr:MULTISPECIES: amino acid ABC transporter substrate-binding protein [unclassified Cryobacterium]MDY7528607.1 amino acid ABC transporter substrate-binding protein [Cryobacterium sp. 10C2]MDY7555655.1 amino acid ABC transporter substrate-binding protein [Cryobacterium sp. 10C3]MEB0201502.1 amino acid ABC transporter substrate-binding protein [Cryobacterium sp. 5I3]MEB0285777.1 amino acid ABC transporter substrate-binding protein [Cryobacterium sp. 10S3]MEB0290357.1 amino acid ABC transporter s
MKLTFRSALVAGAIVTLAALSLTACASGGTAGSTSGATTADDSLAKVQKAGTLTVGTEGTYRPFSFHENGAGDITGYDVDVVKAVAAKLGVTATFQETQWDGIFAGLEAGRFDAIANQVSITPERTAKYTFSTPYTYSTGVIVVKSDNTSITSFESLSGKTTAQSLTSNWNTLATQSGANVQAVEGWAQSVALVEQGRVDATINDNLTFLDYKKNNDASGLKVAATTTDKSESALAFAGGSTALATAVDTALADLAADGTLTSISEKYFGADVSK